MIINYAFVSWGFKEFKIADYIRNRGKHFILGANKFPAVVAKMLND